MSFLFSFNKIKAMLDIDRMWIELANDRASTPICKHYSYSGPRTSTPINLTRKYSFYRIKKKKKKKKELINNDYRRFLFYNQQQTNHRQQKKHFLQIWFL